MPLISIKFILHKKLNYFFFAIKYARIGGYAKNSFSMGQFCYFQITDAAKEATKTYSDRS